MWVQLQELQKHLQNAGINIDMINQGSSEVSMMFGVKEKDEKRAVQALYNEFFADVLVDNNYQLDALNID